MSACRPAAIVGALGGVFGSILLLSGCGSEEGETGPRVGVPVSGTREGKPPSAPSTRAPGDNCYDESDDMYGNPSPEEQLILELINRARLDPDAEAFRLNVHWVIDPDGPGGPINIDDIDINENEAGATYDIQPLHPLAMNGQLLAAARAHCWDMNDRGFFSHTNPDGDGPAERIAAQGYPYTTWGENIAMGFASPAAHHAGYIVDDFPTTDSRGHRLNCLNNAGFVEVGIGYIDADDGATTSYSTEDFGARAGFSAFIVGVVYDDANENEFYDIGEGIADVTVIPDSGDWHAITSDAGGYAIPITMSGTVNVTFQFPAAYGTAAAAKAIDVSNPLARKVDCTVQESDAYGYLEFTSVTYQENEDVGAGFATITVRRTGGSFEAVGVTYATTTGGSATVDEDYTAVTSTLSWGDGDSADKTFTVPIIDDDDDEPNETVNLVLTNATGGAALGTNSTATLTILDEDVAGVLQFVASSLAVGEPDGFVTIEVTRTGGSDGAVEVSYTTGMVTAQAGSDYTTTVGDLSWGHGVTTTQSFNVPIVNLDTDPEPDETFNVTLFDPTNGATVGVPNPLVVTITDDDWPGTISLVAASYDVPEGDAGTTTVTLQVTRTGGRRGVATVEWFTTDGTATSPDDFTAVTPATGGTVQWDDDEDGPKDITVTIQGDVDPEIDEEFTVTLANVAVASLGAPATATVTILDEDDSEPPVLSLSEPLDGATVGGVVTVAGSATDNAAVAKVEIAVDAGPFVEVPGVPLAGYVDWEYGLATWGLANGDHDITVRVTDYRGSTDETTVTVTVENEIGILGANGIGGCAPAAGAGGGAGTLAAALALLAGLLRRRR